MAYFLRWGSTDFATYFRPYTAIVCESMGGIPQTGIDRAGILKTKIEDIENIQSTETIDKPPILNIPELLK